MIVNGTMTEEKDCVWTGDTDIFEFEQELKAEKGYLECDCSSWSVGL